MIGIGLEQGPRTARRSLQIRVTGEVCSRGRVLSRLEKVKRDLLMVAAATEGSRSKLHPSEVRNDLELLISPRIDMQSITQLGVRVRIGTTGWVVPRAHAAALAAEGSHLERYARAMNCVEINSTFYRLHQEKTFARWAASVPEDFRFAVKAPKAVTHEAKLCHCGAALAAFFAQLVPAGGESLRPVLVQLPPKLLSFDEVVVQGSFLSMC